MVRSNLVSGVDRSSVLCEGLESRSLFAANAFEVKTDFGTGDYQEGLGVTLLKDGRVLAVGSSQDTSDSARVLLAAYDKKGALSKSFDGDGKLILSAADTKRIGGYAAAVNQAPDGDLLVTGETGILKLKLGGAIDTAYGVKGFAGLRNLPDTYGQVVQLANGTSRQVEYNSGTIYLTEVDAKGKTVKSIKRTVSINDGELAADANGVSILTDSKFYRFNAADLSKVSKFGVGGVVDLTPAFNKWAEKNGPFYDPQSADSTPVKHPPFYTSTYDLFDVKSGFGFGGGTSYISDKVQPTYPPGLGEPTTHVWFNVSVDGKTVSVEGGPYVPGKFLAKPKFDALSGGFGEGGNGFAGVVTKLNNTRVNVSAFGQAPYSQATAAVLDGDGSFYVVGTVYDNNSATIGLVHTKPV